jgi:molybdopterin converting factor small subunit
MATIRIPTPLRPYVEGQETIQADGSTVGEALSDLVRQYPEIEPHLYKDGHLRSFVNVFLGDEDVRYLDGIETSINNEARLRIIPSIAGGDDAGIVERVPQQKAEAVHRVDQSAIRTNQAFITGLLLVGFIANSWVMTGFASLVMLVGTLLPEAGLFKRIYQHILKPIGLVKPDVIRDNPEPHLFSQGLGGLVTLAGTASLLLGLPLVGWVLMWIVIVLASLNLFVGFCAGCFVYYRLNRLGVPGFSASLPQKRAAGQERSV